MKIIQNQDISRREMLWKVGGGLGGIALTHMMAQSELLGEGVLSDGLHHPPKVKRVLQLFMNGGVSPQDTFDYKPLLAKYHDKKFDPGGRVEAVTGNSQFKVMKSPFQFKRHGQCGRWVSEVFSQLATCVDDLAFLMSMVSKTNVHGPGSYMMNTGFVLPGFPCMGAWISYALGSLNEDLPSFVVLPDHRGLPYNNKDNFSSAFLPVSNQGTIIEASAPNPINDLFPPSSANFITEKSETDGLRVLKELNLEHRAKWRGDSRLDSRIASYELAARMQLSAPDALDLSKETRATRNLYGLDNKVTEKFGTSCLTARRLLERGVRFVQAWSGPSGARNNWDNHSSISKQLPEIAASVDRPITGLLRDLKSRGMLEDTLVIWTTEFGRTPFSQNADGRDHNQGTFVSWFAGAGIKPGVAYGKSDEWGYKSLEPAYCYDFHATILHLLGIDHTRLTYRHNGIDRRLTDVHGHVIEDILA